MYAEDSGGGGCLIIWKSSQPESGEPVQTDGGVIAAGNEVNGDAGPEDLREEEAFGILLPKLMRKIMKRRKGGTVGHLYGKRD